MPRNTTAPEITLALPRIGAARALGIRIERINEAVDAGHLVVRMCGPKARIPVFGKCGLQEWFNRWPQQVKRKRRSGNG